MQPEHWQKVKALLQSALELAPDKREAFLNETCAEDVELRQEVESYIKAHEQADNFISEPVFEAAAPVWSDVQSDIRTGETVGSYTIIEKLGEGGMGVVYLAADSRLGRKIALKLLPAHYASDGERLRRFQQEARAASALNHPNILTIHEIGQTSDGNHFIASEFVEGETLRQKLQTQSFSLIETLEIAIQIAAALSAAHVSGIVHRDIKPENVMIRPDGLVKVLDFGLAKLIENKNVPFDAEVATLPQVQTNPGVVMGTFAYMSPEQARGKTVDARTDTWSLGVVLYEMLTGKPPFAGETASDMITAILSKKPALLATSIPGIPKELERIVGKTLRKDREERYQNIKDLLIDLRDFKRELELETEFETSKADVKANQTTANKLSVVTKEEKAQPTSRTKYFTTRIKNHKVMIVLSIIALIASMLSGVSVLTFTLFLIAAIAGYYFINRKKTALVSQSQPAVRHTWKSRLKTIFVALLLIVSSTAAVIRVYLYLDSYELVLDFKEGETTSKNINGNIKTAVISPDGKYLYYVKDENEEQQSLWRYTPAEKEIEISQTDKIKYRSLNISPDGNFLYFIDAQGSLFRMSVEGGERTEIANGLSVSSTTNQIGIAGTGKMAYVRNNEAGTTELVIAKADGKEGRAVIPFEPNKTIVDHIIERGSGGQIERKLDKFEQPIKLQQTLAWSPDGKLIAGVGTIPSDNSDVPNQFIVVLQVAGCKYQTIYETEFSSIENLIWMPDSQSFLVSGRSNALNQIWQISYPHNINSNSSMYVNRIITDLNDYSSLSLTSDGRSLLAVRNQQVAQNIWIATGNNKSKQLTQEDDNYNGVSLLGWMPDGKIFYDTKQSGIMMKNADERVPRQLFPPDASKTILPSSNSEYPFVSIESSENNKDLSVEDQKPKRNVLFGINSNKKRVLLAQMWGDWATLSPDGNWVIYKHYYKTWENGMESGFWDIDKVPIEGNKPIKDDKPDPIYSGSPRSLNYPVVSPLGDKIAFILNESEIVYIPFDGGEIKKLNTKFAANQNIQWTLKGDAIYYIVHKNGVSNIWKMPIKDDGKPEQVTDFETGNILNFAFSSNEQLVLSRGSFKSDVVLIRNSAERPK